MGFDAILEKRPSQITREPVTATVVVSDNTGVHVAPVDSDNRVPIGPCLGATRPALVDGELVDRQLPVGAAVLLVFTDAGPWVANSEAGA